MIASKLYYRVEVVSRIIEKYSKHKYIKIVL